jgi:hypothetical protein
MRERLIALAVLLASTLTPACIFIETEGPEAPELPPLPTCEDKAAFVEGCLLVDYCDEEGVGSYYCEQCAVDGLELDVESCSCSERTVYQSTLRFCRWLGVENFNWTCEETEAFFFGELPGVGCPQEEIPATDSELAAVAG